MTTMTITVRTAVAHELAGLHRDLLTPSFPAAELSPLDVLVTDVESGRSQVHVAEVDGEFVAVAVIETLGPEVALLAYLVARADQRGTGVGGRLYDAVLKDLRREGGPGLVVAEVEHPEVYTVADPAYGDPVARLRFYGRRGARILDVPYFQPSIGDADPVYGLLLLALAVRSDLTDPAGTLLLEALPLRTALVEAMGGADGSGDGPSDALVAALDAPGGVPLLDVSQVSRVQVSRAPA